MSGDQLLSYMTWAVFLLLFALVARNALRQPHWANLNLVLLFAMPAAIIGIGFAAELGLVQPGPIPNAINSALLMAVAFLMLRLVDNFVSAPAWLLRAAGTLFALLALGGFVFPPPRPPWFSIVQLLFFAGLQLYAAVAFVRAARRAIGVTRRRMWAVALGSLLLGLTVVASALRPLGAVWGLAFLICGLAAGVSYFLGFAPPLRLRRSWQEPELRTFLGTTTRLSRLAGEPLDLAALERAAAAALGTDQALIALWDENRRQLDCSRGGRELFVAADATTPAGRAFVEQRPQFAAYRPGAAMRPTLVPAGAPGDGPRAVLAAPISNSSRRFGALAIFTRHAPIVVVEDIELIELLAGQIAAALEARSLAEELARTRALAQAARLKDDFLSVAAHDLKTPLTTVLGQAQRLERRMRGDPEAGRYLPGVALIAQEAQRLRHLVNELLDASRAERGELVRAREPVDLAALVREVAARYESPLHRCAVEAEGPLLGSYDRQRIEQLVAHLLDNAVVYSPQGGTIHVSARRQGRQAVIAVRDQGIGIPPDDLPQLFGRFFRGSNVDDRHYTGMGLSLFISRAIVEQHGGRIEVSSRLGQGSTFAVTLPLAAEDMQHAAA